MRNEYQPQMQQTRMRISFDLDEVLFVAPHNHKVEPPLRFPFRNMYPERLRLGTRELIPKLRSMGYEVWIYTSSFRSERYIRSLFRHYGITLDGVVNGDRHQSEVQAGHRETMPTKMPNRYGISLHVDDEAIVVTYGKTFGFDVYQLDEQEDDWAENIIKRAEQIRTRKGFQ